MRNLRDTAFAERHAIEVMEMRWRAILAGTARLAGLAGLGEPAAVSGEAGLIAALEGASDWQRELAWQGVEDIAAMLAAGMQALEVLESRGQDAGVPALALWREADAALRGLMAMLTTDAGSPATPVS